MPHAADMTKIRRPIALWVVVGLLSAPVLAGYALQIYFRFFTGIRPQNEGWTLLDLHPA